MIIQMIFILVIIFFVVSYFTGKADENDLLNKAKQGDVQAQFALYQMYKANPDKSDKARGFLVGSATRGYADAQVELGKRLMDGSGVVKKPSEAVFWFKKAIEHGSADASYELGVCYQSGAGVQKNTEQAFINFQQAANRGHAEAQYELGRCYATGNGVETDRRQSIYWCRKASESGSEKVSEIIGYNAVELNKRIPNSATAFMNCCDELFMAGYKLSKFNAGRTKYNSVWVGYAQTMVFDAATDKLLGDMMFYSHPLTFCFIDDYYCMRHIQEWNKSTGREFCHMIELDDAGVLISTHTRWSESAQPPVWLTICARELRRGFTINNPKWVYEYRDAQKYVNCAF